MPIPIRKFLDQFVAKYLKVSIIILIVLTIKSLAVVDNSSCNNETSLEIIKPLFVIKNVNGFTPVTLEGKSSVDRLSKCPEEVTLKFNSCRREFNIKLVRNKALIRLNSFKYLNTTNSNKSDENSFYRNNIFLNLGQDVTNLDHCHYISSCSDLADNSCEKYLSAISIVNEHLLEGVIQSHDQSFLLKADILNSQTILTKTNVNWHHDVLQETMITDKNHVNSKKRYKRSDRFTEVVVKHEPYMSNSSSLFVELLIVHDHGQYLKYSGDMIKIKERTLQLVNIMSSFYRQLNIFISLVGIVAWTEKNEINLTDDGDLTLKEFLKYRYDNLVPRIKHDNAQLITDTKFKDGVVGKALRSTICTYNHSGGVNKDHDYSPAVVAVTIAHELGHNLGMEHDDENSSEECHCPDERCIMSAKSSEAHPKHWSSCSLKYLEDSRTHGLLKCLENKPEKTMGPICGNGFVEDGEDCDIGEPVPILGTSKSRKGLGQRCRRGQNCEMFTINPCCDRLTCKFVSNATCAQGPCCDLNTCQPYNGTETKVCRSRQGECDLEEVCDGKSEYCPDDVYHHDGLVCGPMIDQQIDSEEFSFTTGQKRSYCVGGKCASHESQCQLLWGSTGVTSRDKCFEQNTIGNASGNCGYDIVTKSYRSCDLEDILCGMIYCVHEQDGSIDQKTAGKLKHGLESTATLTVSVYNSGSRSEFPCLGASIDAGPDNHGLVPNGASCGRDRMCLNQKCVSVYEVLSNDWCPSDCNGNGICDNRGVCHCNDGTIGTSCYQLFGANFHLSLLLYMIVFFMPLVGLIVFTIHHYREQFEIWWFLHNKKMFLRNKSRQSTNQNRRMAYNVDGQKVSISDPIPLNQQANSNSRPIYDPFVDPWAEEDTAITGRSDNNNKQLGFRIEPMNDPTSVRVSLPNHSTSQVQTTLLRSNEDTNNLPPRPGEYSKSLK